MLLVHKALMHGAVTQTMEKRDAPNRVLPPEGPPDMERVGAAAQRYGVEILGLPPGDEDE
jgi:hypothetical protein